MRWPWSERLPAFAPDDRVWQVCPITRHVRRGTVLEYAGKRQYIVLIDDYNSSVLAREGELMLCDTEPRGGVR